MDFNALNQDLEKIIQQRSMLSDMDYNDESYDDAEEILHDFEDDFLSNYGEYLEDILEDLYEEHSPGLDVLSPIAYIARNYSPLEETEYGQQYSFKPQDAVQFEIAKAPKMDARLVFVPNPVRLLLVVDKKEVSELWRQPEEKSV
ncbi:hypothetical protein [Bernardetia sp.]|uniref:hypothetical protein n=1 Tax=Bernardetia sp. TaxID=1937974 RepID=UPI0025C56A50|nr:hypothetical protein [Bernardetia sp.]